MDIQDAFSGAVIDGENISRCEFEPVPGKNDKMITHFFLSKFFAMCFHPGVHSIQG
jgi:hypothetical protein